VHHELVILLCKPVNTVPVLTGELGLDGGEKKQEKNENQIERFHFSDHLLIVCIKVIICEEFYLNESS